MPRVLRVARAITAPPAAPRGHVRRALSVRFQQQRALWGLCLHAHHALQASTVRRVRLPRLRAPVLLVATLLRGLQSAAVALRAPILRLGHQPVQVV